MIWHRSFCRVGLALAIVCAARPAAAAQLKVVTTTPDLASVTQAIAGARAEVSSIAVGSQNFHVVEAKPSFMVRARDADLWIRVGLQLEAGWEPLVLQGARNRRIMPGAPGHLDASAGIRPLDLPERPLATAIGLTTADAHPMGNPHYWLDPFNIRLVARTIAAKLKELDPSGAADYDAGSAAFLRAVDEAMFGPAVAAAESGDRLWAMLEDGTFDQWIEAHPNLTPGGWWARMKPLRGEPIVTYHRSWSYFTRRFGLDVIAQVEPKPGIPPGPGYVTQLIETMKARRVRIILKETFYERGAPERIARETGAAVVEVPVSVGGVPEASDYIRLIETIVGRIAAAIPAGG